MVRVGERDRVRIAPASILIEALKDGGHDRAVSIGKGFQRVLNFVIDDGPERLFFGGIGGVGGNQDHLMIRGLLGEAGLRQRAFTRLLLGGDFDDGSRVQWMSNSRSGSRNQP